MTIESFSWEYYSEIKNLCVSAIFSKDIASNENFTCICNSNQDFCPYTSYDDFLDNYNNGGEQFIQIYGHNDDNCNAEINNLRNKNDQMITNCHNVACYLNDLGIIDTNNSIPLIKTNTAWENLEQIINNKIA